MAHSYTFTFSAAHMWMLLNLSFILAADGPGDRFIIGESQAGEQVRAHDDTLDTHAFSSSQKDPYTHPHNLYMKIKYFTFVLHLTPWPAVIAHQCVPLAGDEKPFAPKQGSKVKVLPNYKTD